MQRSTRLNCRFFLSALSFVGGHQAVDKSQRNRIPARTETFRYSYDDADSITEIEKKVGSGSYSVIETFTSDDDGNLLTRVSGGVTTTYTWDDFNRLKAISTSDNSKKQSHTFGISGFRRKKKDKNDVETTEYAAGLSTEVSKVTSGETITYLKGGGGIMGFERSSDGAMFYFITDALSTTPDVVNSSGTVVASYEFSEYGQRIASSESGVSSQKTFVGGLSVQDEVADTGLMMMGHRFYAPDLGRFLNRDPIGFDGGLNLFSYPHRPVKSIDPLGLDEEGPADHPNEILYQKMRSQAKELYAWNVDRRKILLGAIGIIDGINPTVAKALRQKLDDGTLLPMWGDATKYARGFTPGDTIFIDVRETVCDGAGKKELLAALLVHEYAHVSQANKNAAIIDYVLSGFHSNYELEYDAYMTERQFLVKLPSTMASGPGKEAVLDGLRLVDYRLSNLRKYGSIDGP